MTGPIVAGVYPGQPVAVVQEAAALAARLDRALLCGYVTPDSYLTEWERADLRREASLHPEGVGPDDERLAIDLAAAITDALADTRVDAAEADGDAEAEASGAGEPGGWAAAAGPSGGGMGRGLSNGWVLRILAGDPSRALARVAEEVDAPLIVVGTHQSGFGHAVEEWLSGSVAVQLTRAQHRSVVVVPIGHASRRTRTLG